MPPAAPAHLPSKVQAHKSTEDSPWLPTTSFCADRGTEHCSRSSQCGEQGLLYLPMAPDKFYWDPEEFDTKNRITLPGDSWIAWFSGLLITKPDEQHTPTPTFGETLFLLFKKLYF